MNWQAVRTIVYKDLRVVSKSRMVILPMILVPLILLVIIPLIFGLIIINLDPASPDFAEFAILLETVPLVVVAALNQFSLSQQVVIYLLTYFLAPMYLIVPIMAANVIAADSFVGEKERKTLEALLYTPTSDTELYLGKVLAPWLAALIVSFLGFIGYAIVVNIIGAPIVGSIFFPNLMWIILALWVAPAAAGLGLASMVLVSSRMNTFQEAYQVGGLIVLPIVLLLLGQVFGVLFFSEGFVLLIGLVLWLIDAALLWLGARQFVRGELLSRL